jgi:hypothetical protein
VRKNTVTHTNKHSTLNTEDRGKRNVERGLQIWVGTKIRRGELPAREKKILEPKWSPRTPSREVNRAQEYTREKQDGEETGAEIRAPVIRERNNSPEATGR